MHNSEKDNATLRITRGLDKSGDKVSMIVCDSRHLKEVMQH